MKFSWSGCAYAIAIALVIGLGIYTLRGSQGIPALAQKKAEIRELEKGNAELAKEIEQKRARIKRLEDDPEAQELEIRRQLKLVHPGETIFNSQDQDKKTPGR
jgi:cell division protein FtsB